MNETTRPTTPMWFTVVSAIFLVWNLFGLSVFGAAMTIFNNKEGLEKAGLTEQQVDFTLATPTWVNIAFGVAVIFGVLGCIALVMKKKLAIPLLIISLLAVIVQNTHMYFLSDGVEIMGVGVTPFVIAGAIALVPLAMFGATRGWLK